jgi:uncharacterized protein YndB with AHSA1/START domain
MSVTAVHKDTAKLTMTITAHFDASAERVWSLWEDPRQLERWWGPPTYPATFVAYDFAPGGMATYFMTGPEGDEHHGWWKIRTIDAPRHLEFEDGFADADGNPVDDLPATVTRVAIAFEDGRTEMTVESRFPSVEAMRQLIDMGMEEGIKLAIGQIDGILAEAA